VPSFTNDKGMIGAKLKTGYVTLTTPLLGVVCHRKLEFNTVYMHVKLDQSSFGRSRDHSGHQNLKWIT